MGIFRYTKLAYKEPDEMLFGHAKFPVSAHWGLQFGAGFVVPVGEVAPEAGTERSKETLVKECAAIAEQAAARAVDIGLPTFFLEQEHVYQQTHFPDWGGACTKAQADVLERYYDEYGAKCGLRQTVGDIRLEERGGLRGSDYDNDVAAAIENALKWARQSQLRPWVANLS